MKVLLSLPATFRLSLLFTSRVCVFFFVCGCSFVDAIRFKMPSIICGSKLASLPRLHTHSQTHTHTQRHRHPHTHTNSTSLLQTILHAVTQRSATIKPKLDILRSEQTNTGPMLLSASAAWLHYLDLKLGSSAWFFSLVSLFDKKSGFY